MKASEGKTKQREFPHLVTLSRARNIRWAIDVSNAPLPSALRKAYAFHAPGAVDEAGEVTETGMQAIIDGLAQAATNSRSTMCLVRSASSCIYFLPNGSTIDGRHPPSGEPIDPEEYTLVDAAVLDVVWIELPEGSAWPFLCARRLDADHVEISSGDRMVLGHFDELPLRGPGSELWQHLAPDGTVMAPPTFRGVTPTVAPGGTKLLGPVQPDGQAVRIVAAWPQPVFAACEAVAGRRLPRRILERLWSSVDDMTPGDAFRHVSRGCRST